VSGHSGGQLRRPARTLFGGLLRCAGCGGRVVAINAWGYGCAVHHDRGPTLCPTEALVPRAGLDTRLLGWVRDELTKPTALASLESEVRAALDEATASQANDRKALQARHGALQTEIDHLVQSLALVGASPAIVARLKAAEAELVTVSQRLEAVTVPTAKDLMRDVAAQYKRLLLDLRSALDKETDRERTRRLLADVVVGRDDVGAYADLADPATRLLSAVGGDNLGCGGRI
jgi:site-specific DNA recombinase